jgi:hypothetical protein
MTRKLMLRGAIAAALLLVMSSVGAAQGIPAAPGGLTARALDGRVDLAWQPVAGADSYRVLRGTSPGAVTQAVAGGNVGGTSFTDAGAANGQTFYYAVQAIDGGQPSGASRVAGAAPAAAGCSTGNAIAVENCFPGSTSWKVDPGNPPGSNPGIEGFATKTSVDAGESVDLKVNTGDSSSYRMEIYRTGWYGGDQGRLVGTVEDLAGSDQPACVKASDNTGLKSCSNWSVSATLTTTPAWTSGVYLIKLVRPDGRANQILLVVRDDDGPQRLLYSVPDNTYQAYNNYGGKSVYPGNSSGDITVAGDDRAVKVSFDRPYQQTATRQRDFYTFTDLAAVSWLEQQGYSIAYNSSVDLERRRPDPTGLGRREHDLLEGALRERRADDGRLQVDRHRRRGPERHPDGHVARSAGRQPARERAAREHVHRRQRLDVLPAQGSLRAGPEPDLALHVGREPPARSDRIDRHVDRGLGVGRPRRQRP